MSESEASDDNLPVLLSPYERHERKRELGTHPSLPDGANAVLRAYTSKWDDDGGKIIKDADDLIAFMESARCPVCGEPDTLTLRSGGFAFIRGIERHFEKREKMEERGYHPIVCRSRSDSGTRMLYYVGMATPSAAREYEKFKDEQQEPENFKSRARSIANSTDSIEMIVERSYSKGLMLAAIFEMLGAEDYNVRDLMGRENVRKAHLKTIINRLRSLHVSERADLSGEEWLWRRQFGINHGGVKWHVPEWAVTDDLYYSPEDFSSELWD